MNALWDNFRNVFQNLKIFDFFDDKGGGEVAHIWACPNHPMLESTVVTEKIENIHIPKNILKILPKGFHLPPDSLKSVYGARRYPAAKFAIFWGFQGYFSAFS